MCLLCLFATDIDSQSFRQCLSSIFIRLWLIRTRIPRMRNLRASEELHPGPAIVLNGASRLTLAQPLWDMGKPCCTMMDRVLPVLGTFSFGSPSKPVRFLCFLSLWLRWRWTWGRAGKGARKFQDSFSRYGLKDQTVAKTVRFRLVEKTAGASKGTTFSVVCRTLGPLPAKLVPSPSKTRRPVLEFGDRGPAILQSPSGCDPGYDRRQGALRCFHLTQGPVISRAMSTLCRGPVAADVGTASFIACQHGAYSNLLAIFEAFVQRLGKTWLLGISVISYISYIAVYPCRE